MKYKIPSSLNIEKDSTLIIDVWGKLTGSWREKIDRRWSSAGGLPGFTLVRISPSHHIETEVLLNHVSASSDNRDDEKTRGSRISVPWTHAAAATMSDVDSPVDVAD